MERKPVTSSNLKAVGYDKDKRLLEVEFMNGQVYSYDNVPPVEHDRLMKAESIGSYFNSVFRPNYRGIRAEPPLNPVLTPDKLKNIKQGSVVQGTTITKKRGA